MNYLNMGSACLSGHLNRSLYMFSSHGIPHPPTPPVTRAWWTSSTRYVATSNRPPKVDGRRWLVGCDQLRAPGGRNDGDSGETASCCY